MPTGSSQSPDQENVSDCAHHALLNLIESHPAITAVELLRLTTPPSVERRPGSLPAHVAYAEKARQANRDGGSFTEAFLHAAERDNGLASALEVVDFHQHFSDAPFRVDVARDDLTIALIGSLAASTPPHQILVITSRVSTSDGDRHMPFLDFKIESSPRNEPVARAIAARLGGGILLDSGKSYHLYGTELLDDHALTMWLLHAQLFSRCVDTRWITHQLIEKKAALRISKGGARNVLPRVVARLEPRGKTDWVASDD